MFNVFSFSTVKPVRSDHNRDTKIMVIVDRWSLAQVWMYSLNEWQDVLNFPEHGDKKSRWSGVSTGGVQIQVVQCNCWAERREEKICQTTNSSIQVTDK